MAKYEWFGHSYPVSADTVHGVLEDLENSAEGYTHEAFVDVSRPEEAVTHCMFEWDNEIAGEKYRVVQASKIRSSLRIVIEKPSAEKKESVVIRIPAFVNVARDDNRTKARFVSAEKALSESSEYRETVIRNAKKELAEFANKYRVFEEFETVIKAIDELD